MTYLGLYKLDMGILLVYTPVDYLEIEVVFDEELYKQIKTNCAQYYEKYFLSDYYKII